MENALPSILIAEDQPDDLFFLELAFQTVGITHPVIVANDGLEALSYLSSCLIKEIPNAPKPPGLFLLDLKMPRINGFEVLSWIRSRPEFQHLPVIVFSGSDIESDIRLARSLGATDYFTKPYHPAQTAQIVKEIHTRWLLPNAWAPATPSGLNRDSLPA